MSDILYRVWGCAVRGSIEGIRYSMRVDNGTSDASATSATALRKELPRGFLVPRNSRCDRASSSMSSVIAFEKPLPVEEWVVVFPKLPKNVDDPIVVQLDIEDTVDELDDAGDGTDEEGSAEPESRARLNFRALAPILNPRTTRHTYRTVK